MKPRHQTAPIKLAAEVGYAGLPKAQHILKAQAAALSQKSNGLLEGEVETWSSEDGIFHQFIPALDNYRYALLRLHHTPTGYPISIDQAPGSVSRSRLDPAGGSEIADEGSFRSWLRKSFGAQETKRILESLMAQAAA
jgi:hypothetical protein